MEEAIEIYAGANGHLDEYSITLNDCDRPYERMGKKLRLNSLTFSQSKNAFNYNEDIEFSVDYVIKESIQNLFARLEIRYTDDTPIGTFESKAIGEISKGENSIVLSFNPRQLPKGKYYFEIDFYERGANNLYLTVDHPLKKINFSIIDDDGSGIVWDHKRMGHVRLGELYKTNNEKTHSTY